MKNNQHLLHLLLEGTSVDENRATGETSPTVKFVDFGKVDNNDFTAVCQFKLRVPAPNTTSFPTSCCS
jgi:type I restriction enzyme R subunit